MYIIPVQQIVNTLLLLGVFDKQFHISLGWSLVFF